jgi:hypothetical protein
MIYLLSGMFHVNFKLQCNVALQKLLSTHKRPTYSPALYQIKSAIVRSKSGEVKPRRQHGVMAVAGDDGHVVAALIVIRGGRRIRAVPEACIWCEVLATSFA